MDGCFLLPTVIVFRSASCLTVFRPQWFANVPRSECEWLDDIPYLHMIRDYVNESTLSPHKYTTVHRYLLNTYPSNRLPTNSLSMQISELSTLFFLKWPNNIKNFGPSELPYQKSLPTSTRLTSPVFVSSLFPSFPPREKYKTSPSLSFLSLAIISLFGSEDEQSEKERPQQFLTDCELKENQFTSKHVFI